MTNENMKINYVGWPPFVNTTEYNGNIITLNEKTDVFTFFDDDQSNYIRSLWGKNIAELDEGAKLVIEQLLLNGTLIKCNAPSDALGIDCKVTNGIADPRWAIMGQDIKFKSFRPLYWYKALNYLNSAYREKRANNIHGLLNTLRTKQWRAKKINDKKLHLIAENTCIAMKFVLKDVQCLEFSYAVAKIAFEESIKCEFKIGVQTYPFISHAWIEGASGVVMDRASLNGEVSTIVSIGGARC
ncbi:Transglutaminase-like superfamily protein [Marinomonas polaris DSM 16579]|uniref:Transglutaminase-like superfamily protein n=1 Tax=Marinomonas polaris DSM 16579 TaxID=1122206 RepID=A0A1M4VEA1_9GAMM|nr:lasso peptide biosynthesis B2 protein [Marinomonas polaris]SHE67314.1 Transglutaminase-like superfamily protein [Marinomonas polaris DSM 16579]